MVGGGAETAGLRGCGEGPGGNGSIPSISPIPYDTRLVFDTRYWHCKSGWYAAISYN